MSRGSAARGETLMAALLACSVITLAAQTWPYPWPEDRIARYTARRASSPIVIDGRLAEADWRTAERSPRFADVIGGNPGVDDALALLYLRASPGLRLLAMTTVFGNADIDTTTRNALYLRDRFAPGVPVHRGAAAPLSRPRGASPVHVHGENGLGDIDLTGWAPSAEDPGAAAGLPELPHDAVSVLGARHEGYQDLELPHA